MLHEGDRVAYEEEQEASGTVTQVISHTTYEYLVTWDDPEEAGVPADWYHESVLRLKETV